MASQEGQLASADLGQSLDGCGVIVSRIDVMDRSVNALLKKHEEFDKSVQAHQEKVRSQYP